MSLTHSVDPSRRLAELKGKAEREVGRPSRVLRLRKHPKSRSSAWRRPAIQVLALGVLGVLPFVVLVRGSVYFYEARAWPAWLALGAAASATLVLVGAYGAWVTRRITGRARFSTVLKWVALPLVAGYGAHALMFLSSSHAADAAVRAEYRAAHPLLRIALSTLTLARRDLLITDLSRIPADYPRMGLPVNDGTLHYVQRDGWSHAVDLQTGGRSEIVNRFVELYFRAMGFRTRRHVGTGDHLHVELPVN